MTQNNDTAPALLSRAAAIMDERGKQYDQPGGERSMAKCVAAFNAVTGRNLAEQEGWILMALLKMVRFFQNPDVPHRDSVEDLIAYGALFGESALNGSKPKIVPPLPTIFTRRKDDLLQCQSTK